MNRAIAADGRKILRHDLFLLVVGTLLGRQDGGFGGILDGCGQLGEFGVTVGELDAKIAKTLAVLLAQLSPGKVRGLGWSRCTLYMKDDHTVDNTV